MSVCRHCWAVLGCCRTGSPLTAPRTTVGTVPTHGTGNKDCGHLQRSMVAVLEPMLAWGSQGHIQAVINFSRRTWHHSRAKVNAWAAEKEQRWRVVLKTHRQGGKLRELFQIKKGRLIAGCSWDQGYWLCFFISLISDLDDRFQSQRFLVLYAFFI